MVDAPLTSDQDAILREVISQDREYGDPIEIEALARAIGSDTETVRRQLESLEALQLVKVEDPWCQPTDKAFEDIQMHGDPDPSNRSGINSSQLEAPVSELIDEATEYRERVKSNPTAISSKLPRLLALLQATEGSYDSDAISLRDTVLSTVWKVTEENPSAVSEIYPELIETTLDTVESRVLAKRLLHNASELVSQGVSVGSIISGLDLVEDPLTAFLEERLETIETYEMIPTNGSTALALSHELDEFATGVTGREQLAVEAYADALTGLVRHHAHQQSIDPIDGFADLESQYESGLSTLDPIDESELFTQGFSEQGTIEDMIEEEETQLMSFVLRYLSDALVAAGLIVAIERTESHILRAEAVIAEQLQ